MDSQPEFLCMVPLVPIAILVLLLIIGIVFANHRTKARANKASNAITHDDSLPKTVPSAPQQANRTQGVGASNASRADVRQPAPKPDREAWNIPIAASVDSTNRNAAGNQNRQSDANRRHLWQLHVELLGRYDTISKRIMALDTDLGRAMDSLSRQVLEEQRKEFAAQREEIAAQMARIEEQLGR